MDIRNIKKSTAVADFSNRNLQLQVSNNPKYPILYRGQRQIPLIGVKMILDFTLKPHNIKDIKQYSEKLLF